MDLEQMIFLFQLADIFINKKIMVHDHDQYFFLWSSNTCCNLFSNWSKLLVTQWVPLGWFFDKSLVSFHWWMKQSLLAQYIPLLWLNTLRPTSRSPKRTPRDRPPKLSTTTLFLLKKSRTCSVSGSAMLRTSFLVMRGLYDRQETGREQQGESKRLKERKLI